MQFLHFENEENFDEKFLFNEIDIKDINLAFDFDRLKDLFFMVRNIFFSNLFKITMAMREIPYTDLKDIEEKVKKFFILYLLSTMEL